MAVSSTFSAGLLLVTVVLVSTPTLARPDLKPGTALALAPRGDIKKCFADFAWGVQDSVKDLAEITKGCIGEKLDDAKFLVSDMKDFAIRVGKELKEAGQSCAKEPKYCLAYLGAVVRQELEPLVDLVSRAFHIWITIGYTAAVELFGCVFLPGIFPLFWNTLMDILILGQCLISK